MVILALRIEDALDVPPQRLHNADPGEHRRAAGYGNMEARGGAEMPIMSNTTLFAAGAHDEADGAAANSALRLGTSG
jgi:hypothetical protein